MRKVINAKPCHALVQIKGTFMMCHHDCLGTHMITGLIIVSEA